jgi:hypothetical protein
MSDYVQAWKQYKLRRNQYLGILLAYLLFVPLLIFFVERLGNEILFFVIGIPLVILVTYTHERFLAFRCPRCGNKYDRRWRFNSSGFAKKCVYCGLPKYSS